jgi:hypothetical protein
VFWNYFGQTENVVAKGTIDDDHGITSSRVKALPGDPRETFGTASIKNRDVLHVAISRLRREKKKVRDDEEGLVNRMISNKMTICGSTNTTTGKERIHKTDPRTSEFVVI